MLDFKRIGGEVVSSPLNENFRKLSNDISIANTNLIFPESDAIVNTIDEMNAITNPVNAQTCYVISSGELYRYSKGDNKWYKIADFGQTFRQGFLNSGAVVLSDYIKLEEGSDTNIIIPEMLVYFKNKPGDSKYLKGMYHINTKTIDISTMVNGANSYSIYINGNKLGTEEEITITSGMPKEDTPNNIYLGTILVNQNKQIVNNFIFTVPNIAYTADRGEFILENGRAKGLNLVPDEDTNKVNRKEGFYYTEGANFTLGNINNYPIDNDNSCNYNLKYFNADTPANNLNYIVPTNTLNTGVVISQNLIKNQYWNGTALADVPEGNYTIQQHLVTPDGKNIIVYGNKIYTSMSDAAVDINSITDLEIKFPCTEVTRIIIGNITNNFNIGNSDHCRFFTLGKLTQVGTVSPEFPDDQFKIYSGNEEDTIPAFMRFSLDDLEEENFDSLYTLTIAPYNTTRHYFAMDKQYITDSDIKNMISDEGTERFYKGKGYKIADNQDLEFLRTRVDNIEKEIWAVEKANSDLYKQSIKYRLYHDELDIKDNIADIATHDNMISVISNNKVNKGTKINGYTFGDTQNNDEIKDFALKTGDIPEGVGLTSNINLWYTDDRVNANVNVANSINHIDSVSANDNVAGHTKINPHNLSTDDINYLTNTSKVFISPEEKNRITSDKLPENTIQALADLDAKNMDNIKVDKINGSSTSSSGVITEIGNVKGLRFYNDGVGLSLSDDNNTLIVECKGQFNEDRFMSKNEYAQQSILSPTVLAGYVDKSLESTVANQILGIETAGNNKYYGTNETGLPGIYNIKTYVGTADSGSFTDIDQVTFAPIDGSIQDKHLEVSLKNKINNNYHKVYNTGVLSSAEINEFNFGNNLEVTVTDHKATINATGSGSGEGISNFANLSDVNVSYTNNAGKMIVINPEETGLIVSDTPSFDNYMLKTIYVDPLDLTKVKKANLADTATNATNAINATKVNGKIVDDNKIDNTALWTAQKIISDVSHQISTEGVNTYSGTIAPERSLGRNGDLYILIE